eukprot:1454369-Pleurochrysis_carterae.AAC.1
MAQDPRASFSRAAQSEAGNGLWPISSRLCLVAAAPPSQASRVAVDVGDAVVVGGAARIGSELANVSIK